MKYLLSLALMLSVVFAKSQSYQINFKVEGFNDTVAYLANAYAGKQYVSDTLYPVGTGEYVLKGTGKKEPGVYMFVNAEKQIVFQFLIDEQNFSLSTKMDKPTQKMIVSGSEQNQLFFAYWKEMGPRYEEIGKLRQEDAEKNKAKITKLNDAANAFKADFYEKHPNAFITKILKMADEPVIPDYLMDNDSLKFDYYRKHFLDNIDFQDARMVRTPVLHGKLMRYLDDLHIQHPDTLVKVVNKLIDKAEGNYEMYKYLISQLSYKYESSKQMCIDKVFVSIVERSYMKGKTKWVDDVQLEKIVSRAKELKPCLCGNTGNNLVMEDPAGKMQELHSIKTPYTVVFFWDSGCGHCKKTMPKMKKLYEDYKSKGLEIYGVNIEDESKGYLKYIKEKDLQWINVQDTTHSTYFRYYYNVMSSPVIFLLDKDKKIIGKRLGVESIARIIDQELGLYNEEKDYSIYVVPGSKNEDH